GKDARPALAAVVPLLKDTDTALRVKALAIIGAVGDDARATAFSPVIELLRDSDAEVAKAAADALPKLGKPTKAELPALLGLWKEPSAALRVRAIGIIAAVGEDAKETAFKPMLELLRDPDAEVAKAAAEGLTKLGKVTKADLPTLTTYLADKGEP